MDGLDNPIWRSLTGGHAGMALVRGRARAYPAALSPLAAFEDGEAAWADLMELRAPGKEALVLFAREMPLPDGLAPVAVLPLLRMQGEGPPPPRPPKPAGLVRLGPGDGPDMVELAARTRPGPMLPDTVTMGDFWGFRRAGALVAMGGTRMRPSGWIELSGVATDPSVRGEGLARWLIIHLLHRIAATGARPFLHLRADNDAARTLYETLGFVGTAQTIMHWVRLGGE